ncbi:hypothetical protein Tco_0382655 [Tanacetum coccineum]
MREVVTDYGPSPFRVYQLGFTRKVFDNGLSNEELVTERISLLKELHNFNKSHSLDLAQKAKMEIGYDELASCSSEQVMTWECDVTFDDIKKAGIRFDESNDDIVIIFYADDRSHHWQMGIEQTSYLVLLRQLTLLGFYFYNCRSPYLVSRLGCPPSRSKAWDEINETPVEGWKEEQLHHLVELWVGTNNFTPFHERRAWLLDLLVYLSVHSLEHLLMIFFYLCLVTLLDGENGSNKCSDFKAKNCIGVVGIDIPDFILVLKNGLLVQNQLGFSKAQKKMLEGAFYVMWMDDLEIPQPRAFWIFSSAL